MNGPRQDGRIWMHHIASVCPVGVRDRLCRLHIVLRLRRNDVSGDALFRGQGTKGYVAQCARICDPAGAGEMLKQAHNEVMAPPRVQRGQFVVVRPAFSHNPQLVAEGAGDLV